MSGNVRRRRNLRTKQRRAIRALLQGHNQQDAARLAGVTARTVRRWVSEDEDFAAELEWQSGLLVSAAVHRLAGSLDLAVGVMIEIAADPSTRSHVRLRAAESVIEKAQKLREFVELEERIARLEERLEGEAR